MEIEHNSANEKLRRSEYLEKEQKFLDHAKAVIGSVSEDKWAKVFLEPLMIELEKIRKETALTASSSIR